MALVPEHGCSSGGLRFDQQVDRIACVHPEGFAEWSGRHPCPMTEAETRMPTEDHVLCDGRETWPSSLGVFSEPLAVVIAMCSSSPAWNV